MDITTQYSVNCAMEAAITMMLIVLLITYFFHKKLFATTIPFIALIIAIILMLTNQIVTWGMLIYDIPLKYGKIPLIIVYVLDYVLTYSVSVIFYFYVSSLAKDGYKRLGVLYSPRIHIATIMIVWGIVSALFYSVMLFIPSIYNLENGKPVYSIPAYIVLHIISKFACICTIAYIIYHRKVIGKVEAILSYIFITLASVFIIVDEICGLCISYILLSIFTFILYVRIDLYREILLERREREIVDLKTQTMLSQMQPHFLYNVLTTISSMCEMQGAIEARDVVNRFSDYFRTNLDSLNKEKIISFEKELEHIKTYLWLEKIRFEEGLNIFYEIETTDFTVPSLTIQPIVENAVKHGILPKDDAGSVTLKTYETFMDYVIVVKDDGVGFNVNENRGAGAHVGIDNVTKRLEILCGGHLEIASEKGKGTVVTMYIPKGDRL